MMFENRLFKMYLNYIYIAHLIFKSIDAIIPFIVHYSSLFAHNDYLIFPFIIRYLARKSFNINVFELNCSRFICKILFNFELSIISNTN